MFKRIIIVLITLSGLIFAQSGYAISVESLKQKMENGEKLTLVDVRLKVLYQKSHIYNAINIPASLIEHKRLPPLGKVVVYGDGLEVALVDEAVAQLNNKPGISAEALDGGFAAWSSRQGVVNRNHELSNSGSRYVTYAKLKDMALRSGSLILVDLRVGKQLESLASHFPEIRVLDLSNVQTGDVSDVRANRKIIAGIPKQNKNILILIDDGNGLSEKTADKLHAAGVKRLAILAGGELSLKTRGEFTEAVRRAGG